MSELPKTAANTRTALIKALTCVKQRTTNLDIGCKDCFRPNGIPTNESEKFADMLFRWYEIDREPNPPCTSIGIMAQTKYSQKLIENYQLLMEQSKLAEE
ncbi:MAG: hypothetical protein Q7R95_00655 [bacterium]|nr:hypothetical protein [bacterium]